MSRISASASGERCRKCRGLDGQRRPGADGTGRFRSRIARPCLALPLAAALAPRRTADHRPRPGRRGLRPASRWPPATEEGETIAVRGADGRYHVAGATAAFETDTWLRADADPRAANDPSLEEGTFCDPYGCTALVGDSGLRAALSLSLSGLAEDCRLAAIVVTAEDAPADCAAAVIIDRQALAQGGAHAVYVDISGEGEPAFRIVTTRPAERRPWMPPLAPQ